MTTRLINIGGVQSKLKLQKTDTPGIKSIDYMVSEGEQDVMHFTGYVSDYSALVLESMDVMVQPDGVDSVTHEVMRMEQVGDISTRIDNILN